MKKFNTKTFLLSTFVVGLLVVAGFLCAFAEEEGTLSANFVSVTLAKLFYVLRFPTHTLFWSFFRTGTWFFAGLFLNCLFYGFLLERLFAFLPPLKLRGNK